MQVLIGLMFFLFGIYILIPVAFALFVLFIKFLFFAVVIAVVFIVIRIVQDLIMFFKL